MFVKIKKVLLAIKLFVSNCMARKESNEILNSKSGGP